MAWHPQRGWGNLGISRDSAWGDARLEQVHPGPVAEACPGEPEADHRAWGTLSDPGSPPGPGPAKDGTEVVTPPHPEGPGRRCPSQMRLVMWLRPQANLASVSLLMPVAKYPKAFSVWTQGCNSKGSPCPGRGAQRPLRGPRLRGLSALGESWPKDGGFQVTTAGGFLAALTCTPLLVAEQGSHGTRQAQAHLQLTTKRSSAPRGTRVHLVLTAVTQVPAVRQPTLPPAVRQSAGPAQGSPPTYTRPGHTQPGTPDRLQALL